MSKCFSFAGFFSVKRNRYISYLAVAEFIYLAEAIYQAVNVLIVQIECVYGRGRLLLFLLDRCWFVRTQTRVIDGAL